MQNICQKKACTICCTNTNMLLTKEDIQQIQEQGYEKTYFIHKTNHWLQLKNKNYRCIFHDGKKCTIYKHRPQGCKLYPLVYDKDIKKEITDHECPHPTAFTITQSKINKLFKLVSKLEQERSQRKKNKEKSGPVRI